MSKRQLPPDRVSSYFRAESGVLAVITVTGLLYNIGLVAGPWFEGQMTEALARILLGENSFSVMVSLAAGYIAVIAAVQGLRFLKRFYVRRFANKVNRRMKRVLYGALVRSDRGDLERQGAGTVLTKAISDVDDCAEGMRKFTTEVFDTGVALAAYAGMLLWYDWRLALLSMAFLPGSYALAERMKRPVQRTGAAFKEQAGVLNAATMDRAVNALTYRVFGREEERRAAYEESLTAYERAAVKANLYTASLPPLYRVLSMIGAALILYFGGKNVLGTGWTVWSIAEFTTFLACFTKLATKSSKAAKLFNAVHKAQVSWKRIHPYMERAAQAEEDEIAEQTEKFSAKTGESHTEHGVISADHLTFSYPGSAPIFEDLSFTAKTGQIIGITGPVACGKSTLGKTFLCEYPYEGHLTYGGRELSSCTEQERSRLIGYLGHDPELLGDSIRNNVLLGDDSDVWTWLRAVCFDEEVREMEDREDTVVGNSGVRLSGGQAARLALARMLCHGKPVMILDDPFSALDRSTEKQVFEHLKELSKDRIVFLISHRLYLFPEFDQVIWMEHGTGTCSTHEKLMAENKQYAELYHAQVAEKESANDAEEMQKKECGAENKASGEIRKNRRSSSDGNENGGERRKKQ